MRPIMFFVVLQNTFLFLLIKVFPDGNFNFLKSKKYMLAIAYSALVAAVALSPLLFADFQEGAPVPGPGMALFLIHALIFVVGGVLYLIIRVRKSHGVEKIQLQYFLIGTILLLTLLPISNFVAPVAFKTSRFVTISPLYLIVFAALFAYTIIAKRMFDIRAVVIRALAYLLSLGSLGLIYGASIFMLFWLLELNNLSSNVERTVFIVFMLVTAALSPSVLRFFNRVTNKIFYRDYYETQVLLDDLNNTLVNNVTLEALLTRCALILQETIKTSYATFYIRETSYFPARVIGAHRGEPEIDGIDEIEKLAPKIRKKVHLVENSATGEYERDVNRVMRKNEFEVMARLVSTLEYEVRGIGYLFLGPKKSGTMYSKQDLKALEIISNELVIAIENVLRFEEIQQFNVTLQKKIDDATKELQTTNQKLLALDEAKDEFISMASHQLRTPLTSIKGYLSMVLEGDAGPISPTQKEMLGQAFFSSQRMVYLISDLLNVSRLKTGKFIIEPTQVYLPDLIESEISQLQEGAKNKNLTLSFDKPASFPTLYLDEMKIRQVVMNFTDNAIYYTPQHGRIDISLKETPKTVEFRVRDSGIGVPKAERHKLFTKFYRAENARKSRPDGTGLGLFMAKKVIVAQGGSVIFDSKEGKGSTFGFSFPKSKLLSKEPAKKPDSGK